MPAGSVSIFQEPADGFRGAMTSMLSSQDLMFSDSPDGVAIADSLDMSFMDDCRPDANVPSTSWLDGYGPPERLEVLYGRSLVAKSLIACDTWQICFKKYSCSTSCHSSTACIDRNQPGYWQDAEEDAEIIILQQQMERLKGSNSILRSSITQVEQKVNLSTSDKITSVVKRCAK